MTDEPLPPIAPAHVVELSYATPHDDVRPGYLTATGIVSIIIGCVSAIASSRSLLSYLSLMQFYLSRSTGVIARLFADAALQLLALIAAGILIFAGIRLLQNRSTARRLHWLFVAIKVPLALIQLAWMIYYLVGVRSLNSFLFLVAMISVVLSLGYPVALAIILTRPRAKSYFARRV